MPCLDGVAHINIPGGGWTLSLQLATPEADTILIINPVYKMKILIQVILSTHTSNLFVSLSRIVSCHEL